MCGTNALNDESLSRSIPKSVSVGAGAKINQSLQEDTCPLYHWNSEPDSVMRIYFIFESEFEMYRKEGMKCLDDVEPGMLQNIPVG